MTVTILRDERPVARKDHGCNECGGRIGAGDRYRRQSNVDGGDIWTYKAHALCFALVPWDWVDDTSPTDWHEAQLRLIEWFVAFVAFAGSVREVEG